MKIRMQVLWGEGFWATGGRRPARRRPIGLGFDRLEGREAPSTCCLGCDPGTMETEPATAETSTEWSEPVMEQNRGQITTISQTNDVGDEEEVLLYEVRAVEQEGISL